MNNKKYDFIIFGASGFTGQLICEYLSVHKDAQNLNWAIAGRNTAKLELLSNQFSTKDKKINVLYGDSFDKSSLDSICNQSQLLISTVGPYAIYGENLIASCIDNKTHYLIACRLFDNEIPHVKILFDKKKSSVVEVCSL